MISIPIPIPGSESCPTGQIRTNQDKNPLRYFETGMHQNFLYGMVCLLETHSRIYSSHVEICPVIYLLRTFINTLTGDASQSLLDSPESCPEMQWNLKTYQYSFRRWIRFPSHKKLVGVPLESLTKELQESHLRINWSKFSLDFQGPLKCMLSLWQLHSESS